MQACIDALGLPVWQGKGCKLTDLLVDDVAVLAFTLEPHHLGVVGQGEFGLSLIHSDGTLGVSRVVIQRFTPERLAQVVAIFRKPIV
jgi:threonine dehydrogenase-like Zn-dependent dehydrogenase